MSDNDISKYNYFGQYEYIRYYEIKQCCCSDATESIINNAYNKLLDKGFSANDNIKYMMLNLLEQIKQAKLISMIGGINNYIKISPIDVIRELGLFLLSSDTFEQERADFITNGNLSELVQSFKEKLKMMRKK